jgi:hypothetical protein
MLKRIFVKAKDMKATVILKPLEFTLEAVGEKWHQGETLRGNLKIKNHSDEEIKIERLKSALYQGNYKKIKAHDLKGWTLVEEKVLEDKLTIVAAEEKNYSFEFNLNESSVITDKNGSLYLAFFDKDEKIPTGHIELVVEPKVVIKQVLQIYENFLRFKVKEIKFDKGLVEVKLIPPSSRELSNIDGVLLSISEIDKNLTLKYTFNYRALDLSSPTMQVEKKTKTVEEKFSSKQYLIYGDSINQDFIVEAAQTVLNTVKTKTL